MRFWDDAAEDLELRDDAHRTAWTAGASVPYDSAQRRCRLCGFFDRYHRVATTLSAR